MYRLVVTGILSFTTFLGTLAPDGGDSATTSNPTVHLSHVEMSDLSSQARHQPTQDPAVVMDKARAELLKQVKSKRAYSIAYWKDVAQCETSSNWRDKGKWGGGLGIATTTWVGYGGRQFAPHPSQATMEEQIVIANRISKFGFQTKNTFLTLDDRMNNRPFFRPASGVFGWGCVKNNRYLHPHVWHKNNKRAGNKRP